MTRILAAFFRGLVGLLPPSFREAWMDEAERDLATATEAARRDRSEVAALWVAVCACMDVAGALPREWWRVLMQRNDGDARDIGPGMGERTMNWMRGLRLAARTLARRPGYTVTAVVTLSLGIGATVAIFSVVNAVLLRPLSYPDADRLVAITHHAPALNIPTLTNSAGTLNLYWKEADFLQVLAAYDTEQRNLIGGPQPERVEILAASPQIFDVLRVQPAMGRPFSTADAAEDAAPVVLLTHASWISRCGTDPDIVGRTLVLDGVTTEIVGVLPEGFAFPDADAVAMVPLYVDPNGTFGEFGTDAVARLTPSFTLDQAQQRATELQGRLTEVFPDLEQTFLDQAGWSVTVERYQDYVVGDDVASALWVVLGTVGFVFLIACANVANLFLVRA
ncbi:MAG TPA: ABC transporter permease, partial [Bryobacteraceae bacterium]|nr:ABC transporter permease [Bryobacteraceae bacterium]